MPELLQIFHKMLDHFGPRGWWPAETPFEVVVGAILAQSVAWRNVEKAIANLKAAGLFSAAALYHAAAADIAREIVPTRYYQAKTKKLQAFMAHLMERYDGDLNKMFTRPLAALREELLSLYGIGEETADSILLYAGNYPIFVVDAYTKRIFARLGILPASCTYRQVQRFFMENLPADVALFNEYHALIDAVGHYYCRNTNPRCQKCPLACWCNMPGAKQAVG